MKRVRTSKIDQIIDFLESIERGQGNDRYRNYAVDYLKTYADSLEDAKTLRMKGDEEK